MRDFRIDVKFGVGELATMDAPDAAGLLLTISPTSCRRCTSSSSPTLPSPLSLKMSTDLTTANDNQQSSETVFIVVRPCT